MIIMCAPTNSPLPLPGVSFVMPVLNERAYLEHAIASVLAQDVDAPTELVLALGPSTDGTTELAPTTRGDGRPHPAGGQPCGAHPGGAERRDPGKAATARSCASTRTPSSPPVTAALALQTLERTGSANVGGVMHAEGRTPFQKAVARLYNSPVGLGGGAYHGSSQEGEAESAYLGVMRRDVLDEVGLFDESDPTWRGLGAQPAESDRPTTRCGSTPICRSPTGRGRAGCDWLGSSARRAPGAVSSCVGSVAANGIRYFAPPALVVVVALAVVIGVLQLTGVLSGVASLIASILVYVPLALYLLLVIGVALAPRRRERAPADVDAPGAADDAHLLGPGLPGWCAARLPATPSTPRASAPGTHLSPDAAAWTQGVTNPRSRMRSTHTLRGMTIVAGVELLPPGRIAIRVRGHVARVVQSGRELLLSAHERTGCALREVEVEPAQLSAIVIDVGHQEVHRLSGDAEVEHHRGVVGDQGVCRQKQPCRLGVPRSHR